MRSSLRQREFATLRPAVCRDSFCAGRKLIPISPARADPRGPGADVADEDIEDAERLRVNAERGAPFGGRERLLLHTSLFTTKCSLRSTESTGCPVLRYSLPSPLTRSTANTLQHSVRDTAHDRHVSITQSRSASCRRQQQDPVRFVSRRHTPVGRCPTSWFRRATRCRSARLTCWWSAMECYRCQVRCWVTTPTRLSVRPGWRTGSCR